MSTAKPPVHQRILVVHQNFSGQFRRLAKLWSQEPGWEVIGMGLKPAPGLPNPQPAMTSASAR